MRLTFLLSVLLMVCMFGVLPFSAFAEMSSAAALDAQVPGWNPETTLEGFSAVINTFSGKEFTVGIGLENIGTTSWQKDGLDAIVLTTAHPASWSFRHRYWHSETTAARLPRTTIDPGSRAIMKFALTAPMTPGTYPVRFRLTTASGVVIPGSDVLFDVHVRAPVAKAATLMRVAIDAPTGSVEIMSDGSYTVQDTAGTVLVRRLEGTRTRAWYVDGNFFLDDASTPLRPPSGRGEGVAVLRFVPDTPSTVMTVLSLDRPASWDPSINDNRFLGTLELVWSDPSQHLWLVNELSLERYLEGVAEIPNGKSEAYARAIAVATRSYASYHLARGGKHAGEPFILKSSISGLGDDQVYRGFGFTERALATNGYNFIDAVRATQGEVLMYNGVPAIGVYSSDSGGRAKDARAVWGSAWNDKPYLWGVDVRSNPIADPPTTVRRSAETQRASHGVGLSAVGAEQMALEGATYRDILSHYYPGTVIVR